ncbi:MAG: hydantoinase/oxoprolinase family protein [Pyrinomonadaceae bacterium]|nr:hydantoinase/oxoprolinase family protein [Pyrinomonadaceae bacterium]
MTYRLGIDVGGTFTDLLLFNEETGELVMEKTPSTPSDQSIGIMNGIRKIVETAGIKPEDIGLILHGTTVATNAVLEEKGALVGLITTKGFEQILHVARSQTPGPLAGWIIMRKPDPLAPLYLTRGISARMSAKGVEMSPVNEEEVSRYAKELYDAGIEALTVCLINSFANPLHERQVRDIVQRMYPDLPVTISTDILPEFREYERCLTTVMNSYVRPKMANYLQGIQEKLAEAKLNPTVNIMRSDGGVMSIEAAKRSPVNTLLSGPSGGAVAAAYIGELAGFKNVLAFDMGGTSTDVSVSMDGEPNLIRETRVGYYPVKASSVDVRTIGAGGGSIAYVPITGALRVGPQSAGADPGPACYGKGGEEPTVTDANVVLGHLPPKLLGGEMILDVEKARHAVKKIADAMGLTMEQAAQGIIDIVNENMFGALRLVTVQRGLDPRDFALVAFGGAGPLHANYLARLCGSFPAIIPSMPGVLSALGFLHSDIRNEFSQTMIRKLHEIDLEEFSEIFRKLAEEAVEWLNSEKIPKERQKLDYQVDVRYYRQGYEFPIRVSPEQFATDEGRQKFVADFKEVHERNYGFNIDSDIEVVNLRVVGIGQVRKVELPRYREADYSVEEAKYETHSAWFDGQLVETPIYDRNKLRPGHEILGPAIITQKDSTTVILPGFLGKVDPYLNILIYPRD